MKSVGGLFCTSWSPSHGSTSSAPTPEQSELPIETVPPVPIPEATYAAPFVTPTVPPVTPTTSEPSITIFASEFRAFIQHHLGLLLPPQPDLPASSEPIALAEDTTPTEESKSLPSVGYSRKSYPEVTSQRLARGKLVHFHGWKSLALPSVGPAKTTKLCILAFGTFPGNLSSKELEEASGTISQEKNGVCEISQTPKRAAKLFRNTELSSQGCEVGFHLEVPSSLLAAWFVHRQKEKHLTVQKCCEITSQQKGDFATLCKMLPSARSDWLVMAVTSSFQLRIAHRFKHWIVDFLSFEMVYSMHHLDFRKCSKSGCYDCHQEYALWQILFAFSPCNPDSLLANDF
ncbi:hypothetical protein CK203_016565 [Vitis vinifera]|uniref:Uncharacterized protein n=1 Tax=Vitis vinifera TaxID=29760 RepID=A0A438J0V6_VITVI|nr:hypothetical protein CK203_016565 [Vitis vinifera]